MMARHETTPETELLALMREADARASVNPNEISAQVTRRLARQLGARGETSPTALSAALRAVERGLEVVAGLLDEMDADDDRGRAA